jgi:hypothetical protein
LRDLKKLDAGYGYSPLGCDRDKPDPKCFPVRGLGIGLIPTLNEILDHFSTQSFFVNDKDGDGETIELLKKVLSVYSRERVRKLIYIGEAGDLVREKIPDLRVISSKKETKLCFLSPDVNCQNKIFALPLKNARQMPALPSLIQSLHLQNSKLLIFEVNSKEDAEFEKTINPDFVGTYRVDQTISLLK